MRPASWKQGLACRPLSAVIGVVWSAFWAVSAQARLADVELRFCGQDGLRAYPLATDAGPMYGLLLQQFAIVNAKGEPLTITGVEFALVSDGRVLETRTLGQPELGAAGALSHQIENLSAAKTGYSLICGAGQLFNHDAVLGGPVLAENQAMLIGSQPFALTGEREALRIKASGAATGEAVEATATLPISFASSTTQFRFPVQGVWMVKSGPSFHTHHRWALPSEFALDLVRFGSDGRSHQGDGSQMSDYYAYGQPVLAAADGRVVKAVDGQPEVEDLLLRPGEELVQLAQRTAAYAQSLVLAGADSVSGNHIIIDHGNGEYSFYAHLKLGSVAVRVGETVKAGTPIAKVGGSGNAVAEPHLHFHVCDRPTPLACTGIPATFTNVETPYVSFAPRPIQSGDIVIAE